jgi:anti-anti-sigma factor
MTLPHIVTNQVLVITIPEDKLDASNAQGTKTKMTELFASYQLPRVVLNLERLSFIDSVGLGVLISLVKSVREKGGDLKLASMTKSVRSIFELVRLHKLFESYPSDKDAVQAFKT